MTTNVPLSGIELIDCANANSKQNIQVVANLCGFRNDTETFEQQLKKAGEEIGIKIPSFSDLVEKLEPRQAVEIKTSLDSSRVL